MAYCLPRHLVSGFVNALSGSLDPNTLSMMTSAQRRSALKIVIGEDHAEQVNALFESKLLKKNRQAGMVDWIRTTAGLKPDVRNDLIKRVQNMDEVLNSGMSVHGFLEDLAKQKLGAKVTSQEAQDIFNLSTVAENARQAIGHTIAGSKERIDYGKALLNLQDKIQELLDQPIDVWHAGFDG